MLGSFERFIGILIEHYAGAFPFWLAPVQVRVIPVGEGHREAATAIAAQLGGGRSGSTSTTATRRSQADPRRRAREDPVRGRLGDRESDDALAVRGRGGEQSTSRLHDLMAELAYAVTLPSRTDPSPHLPAAELRGGSTESRDEGRRPLLAAAFVVFEEGGIELAW